MKQNEILLCIWLWGMFTGLLVYFSYVQILVGKPVEMPNALASLFAIISYTIFLSVNKDK